MSRFHSDGLHVDTRYLRNHVSELREQKILARKLYVNVVSMRNAAPLSDVYKYNSLLRDIDQMIAYFDRMAKLLTNVEEEANYISTKIGHIIEEDTYRTRRAVSQINML